MPPSSPEALQRPASSLRCPHRRPSSPSSSLQSLLLLLLLFLLPFSLSAAAQATLHTACLVVPSNASQDLPTANFALQRGQASAPSEIQLAPLTQHLLYLNNSDLQGGFIIKGQLVHVDATNSFAVATGSIALVSCDAADYQGNLNASQTLTNILTSTSIPTAIILYSTRSDHCNYTAYSPPASRYNDIFTILKPSVATTLLDQLTTDKPPSVSIVSNMSMIDNSPGGSGPGTTPSGGGGPNTAMVILYSITGIITALFLGIIITGAVRAHRHPERYGPRRAVGRTRQSRAKGIARAMLDTIPIVKFGDVPGDHHADTGKGDIELGPDGNDEQRAGKSGEHVEMNETSGKDLQTKQSDAGKEGTSDAPKSAPSEHAHETGNNMCPICTDDFIKGQDIRLLPCNHQFHPECIDPWLVNVSGTCPLCRIDLHPAAPVDEEGETSSDNGAERGQESASASTREASQIRQHRGLAAYLQETLNVRRMLDASPEERLEALRNVRHISRGQSHGEENAEERRRHGIRLASRLRDRFRIRTRRHGDPDTQEQ